MKRKAVGVLCFWVALLLAVSAFAQGSPSLTVGTLVTAAAPYDITAIVPDGMESIGSTDVFSYGYRNNSMLLGFTPAEESDFDTFRENRMSGAYLTETELTVNGLDAREYAMPADSGILAVYAVKASASASIMEIAFCPRYMDDTAANQAFVDEVLGSVRSRSQTYAADSAGSGTSILFSHSSAGLCTRLPGSFIKCANPIHQDSIAEYQNDYLLVIVFGYQSSLAQYITEYDMNKNEFDITDKTVNGVSVHVFVPKSAQVSTDLAYIVAEGQNGTLLEFIVGATDASEETENWMYINQIIDNIAAL